MKVTLHWAAKIVSGSCYVIEVEKTKFLVDCGMFQWPKEIARLNYQPFKFDPKEIQFVLLTHAHIDHSGLLPKLHKEWFNGKIYTTSATKDLVWILLEDSANIQEENIKQQNIKRARINLPPRLPLFTLADAQSCMALFSDVEYNKMYTINENIQVRYQDAGHILGSASIEMFVTEGGKKTKIVFSWDLWQRDTPIVQDPTLISESDYVFMESTYGDRLHEHISLKEDLLLQNIMSVYNKWGKLLIPSFAVERTQELLYYFNKLIKKWVFPKQKIFLDSPLANRATELFKHHTELFDKEAAAEFSDPFDVQYLEYALTPQDSQKLNNYSKPCIIIAWNGMCTAGRITHHLKHGLRDKKNTLMFVWYQAEWTLWRYILEWAKMVHIMWSDIAVNADITKINSFSGHADANQLIKRAKWFTNKPQKVFITHGEPSAQAKLWEHLKEIWLESYIPSMDETIEL